MPRLGSNFFNAYNDQVDTLRKRRSENVESFNSFVKMRTELGETASVSEMEKMRNALAGGDGYFMNALPTGAMLAETEMRLKENQADERAKERNQVLQNVGKSLSNANASLLNQNRSLMNDEAELAFAQRIAGDLTNLDLSTPEGQAAFAKAYETMGQGELYEKYKSLTPNMHESARLTETEKWITANGFRELTTTAGIEGSLTTAPTWMKPTLKKVGENQLKKANTSKVEKATQEVISNFQNYLDDAGGDPSAVQESVKFELKYKLGELYTDKIFDDLMGLAQAQIKTDQSNRLNIATGKLQATEDELLSVQDNPEAMRALARTKLIQGGAVNPSPSDVDEAVGILKSQQVVAVQSDFEKRLEKAAIQAAAIDREDLELLTTTQKIDDKVNAILTGQLPNYDSLSEGDKAEAISRVKSIISTNAKSAVEAEGLEDQQAVIQKIGADESIKLLAKGGPSKEKMSSVYARVNELRRGVGLHEMNHAQIKVTYGAQIDRIMNIGASERYATQSKQIREDALAVLENINKDHISQMETVAGMVGGEPWSMVAEAAQLDSIPRTSAGYQAFANHILRLQEAKVKPPATPTEAATMAREIAQASGWLPKESALQVLVTERLSDEDLIRPDTDLSVHLKTEKDLIEGDLSIVTSQIKNQPRDKTEDVRHLVDETLEIIDEWEAASVQDLKSADIVPLISGLDSSTFLGAETRVRATAEVLRKSVKAARPSGQYSFLSHLPGPDGGVFQVGTSPQDLEAMRAVNERRASDEAIDRSYGAVTVFEPGATYRAIPSTSGGLPSYEEVLGPPTGSKVSAARTLQDVDPEASPFKQDVQQIILNSDLNSAAENVASRISSSGFQDLPPSAPLFRSRVYQYFFGSTLPDAQAKLQLSQELAAFLRLPSTTEWLKRNPETYPILFEDPLSWANAAGLGR